MTSSKMRNRKIDTKEIPKELTKPTLILFFENLSDQKFCPAIGIPRNWQTKEWTCTVHISKINEQVDIETDSLSHNNIQKGKHNENDASQHQPFDKIL